MAQASKIEWTDASWNPVTGCTKVSAGCRHCYAERMARRLQSMEQPRYRNGFSVTLQPDVLPAPARWRKPRMVFVNSMSDLFHEEVPLSYIRKVFSVMEDAHWHVFQVLTKRAGRLAELSGRLEWPRNVWIGVTVESSRYFDRVSHLLRVPGAVRFVSLELLLGPVASLDVRGLDWVIVGGESGPGARPMKEEWVIDIRDRCLNARVPFFFKQWGGRRKKKAGRLLQGRTWDELPTWESHQSSDTTSAFR